jgi:hypothetical protein
MPQNGNAAADEARGVPELTKLGGAVVRGNSLLVENTQAIRADLIGSNTCTAASIAVVDHAPVLALCRALVAAGQDPNRPLRAYRGDVLCLRVRSIGEGAQLVVEVDRRGRPRLRRWRNRVQGYGAAPSVRQIGDTATTDPPRAIVNGRER